ASWWSIRPLSPSVCGAGRFPCAQAGEQLAGSPCSGPFSSSATASATLPLPYLAEATFLAWVPLRYCYCAPLGWRFSWLAPAARPPALKESAQVIRKVPDVADPILREP